MKTPKYAVVVDPQQRNVSLEPVGELVEFKQFYKTLDCHTIEIFQLKPGIDLLCDEEGYYKSGNELMYISISDDKIFHQMIGSVAIVKNAGEDLLGWTIEEIDELVEQIKIKWSKN
jgi:hypothetical protein